jgi:hypothetical protein
MSWVSVEPFAFRQEGHIHSNERAALRPPSGSLSENVDALLPFSLTPNFSWVACGVIQRSGTVSTVSVGLALHQRQIDCLQLLDDCTDSNKENR